LRREQVRAFLRLNEPLLIFLTYCLVSVFWSDYPSVALKRCAKAVGDLVMVLIVLTDPEPTTAIKRFLSRSGFLLIPVSVLLIKYYPALGRGYSAWTGEAYNNGVSTQKNGLGYDCVVFGLASVAGLLDAFRSRERGRMSGHLIAHGTILALTFWLFNMAHSATSLACFLLGSGFMLVASLRAFGDRPGAVHALVAALLFTVLYATVLNPGAGLLESMGRDSTLTGRTAIWDLSLSMNTSPSFGAGYESFWLQERVKSALDLQWKGSPPNQAHNGYLQVYLDLGWAGVALLGLVMVWGYRNISRALRVEPDAGRLKLTLFLVVAVYNLTEAAFRDLHPMWILFLLAVTVVPDPSPREVW
jgi:exopolysaccharide production protein ExoQ